MKKIILTIIILSLLFGTISLAQNTELPSPGITPDSLFYFLDTLAEKIGMFFTFSAEKKAEKAIKYAEEKLAEIKAMAERNKVKALEKANQKYQEYLGLANERVQEAKEKGKDVEELAILITEKTLKHQEILVGVLEKVPEEVKMAIEKAIEVSRKGSEEAVQAVTGAKKEELQQKIEEALIIPVNWKAYRNEKYGYFFKYPPDCFYGPMPVYCKEKPPEERPPECLCFLNSEDPDRVFLQAFTGEKDSLTLADFSVSHYETSWYNPPPDTDLIKWLKEKFSDLHEDIPDKPNMEIDGIPAVKIYTPSSPMAFSGEGIYFIRNDMLFMVSMLDVDSESNKELYNQILSTFKFVELEEAKEEAPEVEEKPYIRIISPNGGEEWKVGNTYNITWASEGVEKVNIFLLGCKTKECPVESGISSYKIYPHSLDAEAGKYSWTIYSKDIGFGFGFGISEYACFKIKIEEASSESVGILDKFLSMLAYISNKLGVQTSDLVKDVSDECFRIIEVVLPEEPPVEKEKEEVCLLPETPVLTDPGISVEDEVFTVKWTGVEGAKTYRLQRDTNPNFSAPLSIPDYWLDYELNSMTGNPNPEVTTTYYYRAKACNDCGCSSWSNVVDMRVEVRAVSDTPVLIDPGISVNKHEAFTLNWTSIKGAKRYWLQRDTTTNFSIPPWYCETNSDTDNPGIGTSYPEVSTTYYYRVKACDDQKCGAWSNVVDMRVIVSPSITVTSPNGGEKWVRGNSYEIKWDSFGVEKVNISVLNFVGSPPRGQGVTGIDASLGRYLFKVSDSPQGFIDLPAGDKYKVLIRGYTLDGIRIEDYSDNFFSVVSSSITVTSPNGGEEISTGPTTDPNRFKITYQITNFDQLSSPTIRIDILQDDVLLGSRCSPSCPAYSDPAYWNFSWDVGSYMDSAGNYYKAGSGTGYKIRIILFDNGEQISVDESDNFFSIVSPFVTVTSPNGGEVWAEDVTHRIKWDSAGVDSVQIRCLVEYGDGNSEKFSVVQLAKNLGYYDWAIPDLSTKFEYKYKIWVGDPDGFVSDWSDDYFQIGPSPPPEP